MNTAQQQILRADFEEWWLTRCWLKVGKLAAEKEYYKARRIASREKLLEAAARYPETKPPDQPFCHPRTWFAQGRFLDEVPVPKRKVAGSLHNWWDE